MCKYYKSEKWRSLLGYFMGRRLLKLPYHQPQLLMTQVHETHATIQWTPKGYLTRSSGLKLTPPMVSYSTAHTHVPGWWQNGQTNTRTTGQKTIPDGKAPKQKKQPEFPQLPISESGDAIYEIGNFLITEDSWMLFKLLGIDDIDLLAEDHFNWESADGFQNSNRLWWTC